MAQQTLVFIRRYETCTDFQRNEQLYTHANDQRNTIRSSYLSVGDEIVWVYVLVAVVLSLFCFSFGKKKISKCGRQK